MYDRAEDLNSRRDREAPKASVQPLTKNPPATDGRDGQAGDTRRGVLIQECLEFGVGCGRPLACVRCLHTTVLPQPG